MGKRIVDLQHTEVPDAYRGRGIAKHLAKVPRAEGGEGAPSSRSAKPEPWGLSQACFLAKEQMGAHLPTTYCWEWTVGRPHTLPSPGSSGVGGGGSGLRPGVPWSSAYRATDTCMSGAHRLGPAPRI